MLERVTRRVVGGCLVHVAIQLLAGGPHNHQIGQCSFVLSPHGLIKEEGEQTHIYVHLHESKTKD